MHIVIDLLEAGDWNEAERWITKRYIPQPGLPFLVDTIVKSLGGRTARPLLASPKEWLTKVLAVLAQGDLVWVATRVE